MSFLKKRQKSSLVLLLILFFAFVTRVWRLHLPERYIFDEVYHAVTAKLIAQNDPRAFEWWHSAPEPKTAIDWLHPPLAKYSQALSIKVFGANSFGWRFSSALFGVGVIYLVYRLSLSWFNNDQDLALLAAFLASLDGLLLVQSRIAMNDIHVTFFILLTLWLFARWREKQTFLRLALVGVGAGLSLATKWSGLFVVGIIWLLWGWEKLHSWLKNKFEFKSALQALSLAFLALFILPAIIYVGSYGQMFLQGKDWAYFVDLHQQIWSYQTGLEATHPYQSRPWEWFLNLRPVWLHVDYVSETKIANIYAFGNPLLFWFGALSVVRFVTVLPQLVTRRKNKVKTVTNRLLQLRTVLPLFIAYLLLWLPWMFSPRIMFFYHYTPAVPLLCIILAHWLLKLKKWLLIMIVTLIVLAFVVWLPHWIGLAMPKQIVDTIYFALNSWK